MVRAGSCVEQSPSEGHCEPRSMSSQKGSTPAVLDFHTWLASFEPWKNMGKGRNRSAHRGNQDNLDLKLYAPAPHRSSLVV